MTAPGESGQVHKRSSTQATAAPNIKPSALRLFRFDDTLPLILKIGIGGTFFGALLTWFGRSWLGTEVVFMTVVAWIACILGGILLIVGIGFLVLFIVGWKHGCMCYRNGLLSTGIVLDSAPVKILYMANMSTGFGPSLHGLRSVVHARYPGKVAVGDHIPAVSVFQGDSIGGTWKTFSPTPLVFGTGNKKKLTAALEALAPEDFRVMEKCIRDGVVPEDDEEIVIIEEDGTFVEKRSASVSLKGN